MNVRSTSEADEDGFSLAELLVGMIITLIIAAGAATALGTFYSGSYSAQQLANRVATTSVLTSIMDHTLGMQGYYDAATVSVAPMPIESPTPVVPTQSVVGPVNSVTVYWLPTAATASPYCQGTLSSAKGGLLWDLAGPSGCAPANATGKVFYPVGSGWSFYLVANTDCKNSQVQQTATAVLAINASSGTEALTCLGNT
jgi:prepilin-type N-terminal cleavage/methylation domain-containing protein